jgi:hypothetical protein
MAFALKNGMELLKWLRASEQRAALVAAAENGLPSVAGISESLRAKFGANVAMDMITRQFIGMVVKSIMIEEGYVIDGGGVKLSRDPVFSSGSRYRRATPGAARTEGGSPQLLERLVGVLNTAELQELISLAQREFLKVQHKGARMLPKGRPKSNPQNCPPP